MGADRLGQTLRWVLKPAYPELDFWIWETIFAGKFWLYYK